MISDDKPKINIESKHEPVLRSCGFGSTTTSLSASEMSCKGASSSIASSLMMVLSINGATSTSPLSTIDATTHVIERPKQHTSSPNVTNTHQRAAVVDTTLQVWHCNASRQESSTQSQRYDETTSKKLRDFVVSHPIIEAVTQAARKERSAMAVNAIGPTNAPSDQTTLVSALADAKRRPP